MKKEDIISAYCKIREMDNTIPDEVLDLMKNAALEKVESTIKFEKPEETIEYPQKHDFEVIRHMRMETSFGSYGAQKDVKLKVTVGLKDKGYGYFEIYDEETGGDKWYAEGGIWFSGKNVTDYDGVFELPDFIISKLEELGFNTDEL